MNKCQNIEKQIHELDEWIKTNPDSRELKRALAVKLSLQGWVYREIANLLNVSDSVVGQWKNGFKQKGIEGLKLSYKGAKSYLTEQQKQQVLTWLQMQEYWDLSELECYLVEEFDVVFKSKTSYYNLLNEAKISWQKAQPKNPRQDPDLVKKKNQEIKDILLENLPDIKAEKVVVYAIDEVHLLEGDLISHLWGAQKDRLNILIANQKNRQTYYGALNLVAPQLIVEKYEQGNGDCTVDFLKKLLKQNPGKRIIIFWDGAAYHRGEKMRELLAEINQGLEPENWQITCHLFAPYAPEENPIEAIWLTLKNLLRRCYRFCKNFRIMKKIFQLLVDFNLFNFPNLENYDAFSCLI
jgi:transposase